MQSSSTIDEQQQQQQQQQDTLSSGTLSTSSKIDQMEASPASSAIGELYVQLVKDEDIQEMRVLQQEMFSNMKSNNRALKKFNDESSKKLSAISFDYHGHAKMLREMKADLEYITKKIKYVNKYLYTLYSDTHTHT
jgi:hypothetical protein